MTEKNKIDKIQQRIEELKSQLRQEKAKENTRQRKIDTRKKILLGAMLMHWVENGEFKSADLLEGLDKFLTRDSDRVLFGLPSKSNDTTSQSASTQKKKSTTKKSSTKKQSSSSEPADTSNPEKDLPQKQYPTNRSTFTPVIIKNEDL